MQKSALSQKLLYTGLIPERSMVETLSNFFYFVPQSTRREKIGGTNFLTGTRYVQTIDVVVVEVYPSRTHLFDIKTV